MLDPEFYNKCAENCLQLCKNFPGRPENYRDVNKKVTDTYDFFLENLCKKCQEILTNTQSETTNLEKCTQSLINCRFLTEVLAERNARYKMGLQCVPTQHFSFDHFIKKQRDTYPSTASKLNFRVKDLCAFTHANGLVTTNRSSELHKFYLDEKDTKLDKKSFEHLGVSGMSLQSKVRYVGTPSSFWAPNCPLPSDFKPKYIESSEIMETNFIMDLAKNISDAQKYVEKSACPPEFADPVLNVDTSNYKPPKTRTQTLTTSTITSDQLGSGMSSPSGSTDIPPPSPDATTSYDSFVPPPPGFGGVDVPPPPSAPSAIPPPPAPPGANIPPPPSSNRVPYAPPTSEPAKGSPSAPLPPLPPMDDLPKPPFLYMVEAMYNYKAKTPSELSFKRGDQLEVLEENENGWDFAKLDDAEGYIPRNYVKKL